MWKDGEGAVATALLSGIIVIGAKPVVFILGVFGIGAFVGSLINKKDKTTKPFLRTTWDLTTVNLPTEYTQVIENVLLMFGTNTASSSVNHKYLEVIGVSGVPNGLFSRAAQKRLIYEYKRKKGNLEYNHNDPIEISESDLIAPLTATTLHDFIDFANKIN